MNNSDGYIGSIVDSVLKSEGTARSVALSSLDAAEELNETLNAFLEINRTDALDRADRVDRALHSVEPSLPLAAVPIAIKDNICVRGLQTSCGSRILGPYQPPYDATVIERLSAAGAVIVGKTNCDEFAMGSSNENSAFGPVRNPWNTDYVPGGSSGGSAAAVAAGIVPVALGSDTGGSIRQPASLCGIAGLKPTYGRVSRYGLVAFASSLDQIGVFGRYAKDIARILQVIAGRDPMDSTTANVPVPNYEAEIGRPISDLRIGVPRSLIGEGVDADVQVAIDNTIEAYRELGAKVIDVELPHARYCIAVYYIIATAEASSNLARFDGVRYGFRAEETANLRDMYRRTRDEGFGPEVKRRIMLGTYVLSSGYYEAYYRKAQQVRALIKRDLSEAFTKCDAILTPTSPTPAFLVGEKVDDPLSMYLSDIYTATANLAGVPGISVPCELSSKRLPIGFQLMGNHWSEGTLLRLSHAFERVRPFNARPPVHANLFDL